MTAITVTKKLQVESLLDIQNPEFAHQYELGVWWALYGDEQGKGLYDDDYLIGNVNHNIESGRFANLGPCHSLGFYLGMIHGGNIDPKRMNLTYVVPYVS